MMKFKLYYERLGGEDGIPASIKKKISISKLKGGKVQKDRQPRKSMGIIQAAKKRVQNRKASKGNSTGK